MMCNNNPPPDIIIMVCDNNSILNNIDAISNEITNRDEKIFDNDLYLLKDICFKKLWCTEISDKTKDNIWKYLQSFCLINININSNDKLTEALSDIENKNKVSKKVANDLKNYKKINEDFSAPSASASNPSDVELEGFDNILNNTSIGKIAKEITEELTDTISKDEDFNLLMGDILIELIANQGIEEYNYGIQQKVQTKISERNNK